MPHFATPPKNFAFGLNFACGRFYVLETTESPGPWLSRTIARTYEHLTPAATPRPANSTGKPSLHSAAHVNRLCLVGNRPGFGAAFGSWVTVYGAHIPS